MTPYPVDNSQVSAIQKCEVYWYEKYVKGVHRTGEPVGQKSDVLTLGSLVHEGLRELRQHGQARIPEEAIAKYGPSPECVAFAQELVLGYSNWYPVEDFKLSACEAPLEFKIPVPGIVGLAKIDYYFHVETSTQISSGIVGGDYVLNPGWWIKEYKTRDGASNRGHWIDGWQINLQAAFQMLALQEHLGEPVQGVLVDVLEKPKIYVPKRTCKKCKIQSEWPDWIPTNTNTYKCSKCGHEQELSPITLKDRKNPEYFRLMVTRTPEQRLQEREEIVYWATRIRELLSPDTHQYPGPVRRTTACVHPIYGQCEYYTPHSVFRYAEPGRGEFVQIADPLEYIKS